MAAPTNREQPADCGDATELAFWRIVINDLLDSESTKRLSAEQRELVASIRERKAPSEPTLELVRRAFVRKWTVSDLRPHLAAADTDRSFIRGRTLYNGMCAKCHLFKGKGGALGPDLVG